MRGPEPAGARRRTSGRRPLEDEARPDREIQEIHPDRVQMAVSAAWAPASYICHGGKGGDSVNDHLAQLVLHVDRGTGTDAEEFDELTFQLGQELLELDVHSVGRPRQGPAPPGTRAGEILALGTLMVTVAKSAAALSALVGAVRSW